MNKLRIKKWVKNVIAIISIIIVISILTHLVWKELSDIAEIQNQCDQEYGHICSQYELRLYILEGNRNGK